jgi:hypothetical protein
MSSFRFRDLYPNMGITTTQEVTNPTAEDQSAMANVDTVVSTPPHANHMLAYIVGGIILVGVYHFGGK